MVIAVIDTRREPDRCASLVRGLLPRAACLITPTVHDIWRTDSPVPPISGVLRNGAPGELPPEEQEVLAEMARRFPLAAADDGAERLAAWADRCASAEPQLPRKPDRIPWGGAAVVELPDGRAPRMCVASNVSAGGLFLVEPRSKPRVGDRVSVRFPSLGPTVRAQAIVRWVQARGTPAQPAGYGCEFVDTSCG